MNFLYQIYFWLPNFYKLGFTGKVINRVMSRILKVLFELFVPAYLEKKSKESINGVIKEKRQVQYIVSLTSFPARIDDIWLSLETIMQQSFKPDKIILWLASEQFPEKKLPVNLLNLQNRGLTIRFCDDLRSHKKYYYAFKEFPNDYIITLDDDLYYHRDVLKNIVELHKKYPNCICTNRAHEIVFEDSRIAPYRKWKHNSSNIDIPTHRIMQTGGAGTLYPPNSLNEKAFDKDLIKELCFHADDIWLKFMGFLNGTKVVTNSTYDKDYITVGKTQNEKLVTQNVLNGGNDKQLKNVVDFFGIDVEKLKI